jgi:hypothetical protein
MGCASGKMGRNHNFTVEAKPSVQRPAWQGWATSRGRDAPCRTEERDQPGQQRPAPCRTTDQNRVSRIGSGIDESGTGRSGKRLRPLLAKFARWMRFVVRALVARADLACAMAEPFPRHQAGVAEVFDRTVTPSRNVLRTNRQHRELNGDDDRQTAPPLPSPMASGRAAGGYAVEDATGQRLAGGVCRKRR